MSICFHEPQSTITAFTIAFQCAFKDQAINFFGFSLNPYNFQIFIPPPPSYLLPSELHPSKIVFVKKFSLQRGSGNNKYLIFDNVGQICHLFSHTNANMNANIYMQTNMQLSSIFEYLLFTEWNHFFIKNAAQHQQDEKHTSLIITPYDTNDNMINLN